MSQNLLNRKKTRAIFLKDLKIGDYAPISVQSMIKVDSRHKQSTVSQIKRLESAGCEIIRISIPDEEALCNLETYIKTANAPIVADIHFNYKLAIESIKRGVHGVRINPGNIGDKLKVKEIIKAAKDFNTVIRIGVNAGSLEKDILNRYGLSSEALVESALRWIKFFEDEDFLNFKVSVKSSSVAVSYKAYLLLSEKTEAPLHLGITEAGFGEYGIVKSSVGIGSLLLGGIGDTIRVSLTGDPVREVVVGFHILKSLGLKEGVEVISCPTCSRVKIDVESLAFKVWEEFKNTKSNIKIAVMGCEVNGPGEAKEADCGIAGGIKYSLIFKKGKIVKKVRNEEVLLALKEVIGQLISQN